GPGTRKAHRKVSVPHGLQARQYDGQVSGRRPGIDVRASIIILVLQARLGFPICSGNGCGMVTLLHSYLQRPAKRLTDRSGFSYCELRMGQKSPLTTAEYNDF